MSTHEVSLQEMRAFMSLKNNSMNSPNESFEAASAGMINSDNT